MEKLLTLVALLLSSSSCLLANMETDIANKEIVSYASMSDENVRSVFDACLNNQKDTVLNDFYSTEYFSNLHTNFGNNSHGTCSYVALGMLLSFYDTYWDDTIIPEAYDVSSAFDSSALDSDAPAALPFSLESPGISFEDNKKVASLSNSEYMDFIESTSSTCFQSRLITIKKQIFGNFSFESDENPYGMTFTEIQNLLGRYLFLYRDFQVDDFSSSYNVKGDDTTRQFVVERINEGMPVLIMATSETLGAHSMIAYDYDAASDTIFAHPGWRNEDGEALTHASLKQLGFSMIESAITLNINRSHSHSDNYVSSSEESFCSCSYANPQNIRIVSGNYKDMNAKFAWDSLYKEKWYAECDPYFELDALHSDKFPLFSVSRIEERAYTFTDNGRVLVLYFTSGNSYYIRIKLSSRSHEFSDECYAIKLFEKPEDYKFSTYIKPSEYGFADAYPTDDSTKINFTDHQASNGFKFKTRRYRTGYIHNEYVVMSPIRKGINEAFIEYSFMTAITRLDVELAHWREYSKELLDSSTGEARLEYYSNGWQTKLDLLSEETCLPQDRSQMLLYKITFDQPVYRIRFYSKSSTENTNDSNRGRICIGDMVFHESEYSMPLSCSELDYEPNNWNEKVISSFLWKTTHLKDYTNCYSYAVNAQKNPTTNSFDTMQPGQASKNSFSESDLTNTQKMLNIIKEDASVLGFGFTPIGKNEVCSTGSYKIAFVLDNQMNYNDKYRYDYHWYRQNSDGSWSHKPGLTNVTNLDASNDTIMDPEMCDRNYGQGLNYNLFVGFFVVKPLNILV